MPKQLCGNPDNICLNRPGGRSGRGNSQDNSELCAWTVAVPMRTLDTGASGVKYHPLTPESTIAVSCLAILVAICMANLHSHFG